MNACRCPFCREQCASPRQKQCHSRSVRMLREVDGSQRASRKTSCGITVALNSPAALAGDSTACLMTKASTGLTMISNLPVICSLTAKFSRSSRACRPCLSGSRQCQGQGCLICHTVTLEMSSGESEGGRFYHLALCPYVNK